MSQVNTQTYTKSFKKSKKTLHKPNSKTKFIYRQLLTSRAIPKLNKYSSSKGRGQKFITTYRTSNFINPLNLLKKNITHGLLLKNSKHNIYRKKVFFGNKLHRSYKDFFLKKREKMKYMTKCNRSNLNLLRRLHPQKLIKKNKVNALKLKYSYTRLISKGKSNQFSLFFLTNKSDFIVNHTSINRPDNINLISLFLLNSTNGFYKNEYYLLTKTSLSKQFKHISYLLQVHNTLRLDSGFIISKYKSKVLQSYQTSLTSFINKATTPKQIPRKTYFNISSTENNNEVLYESKTAISDDSQKPNINPHLIFKNWLFESMFSRKNFLTSPNAIFVLTQVPSYRMDVLSETPISTSMYNGNIFQQHTRSFTNFSTHANAPTTYKSLFKKVYVTQVSYFLSKSLKSVSPKSVIDLCKNSFTHKTNTLKSKSYNNIIYPQFVSDFILSSNLKKGNIRKLNLRVVKTRLKPKSFKNKLRLNRIRGVSFSKKYKTLTPLNFSLRNFLKKKHNDYLRGFRKKINKVSRFSKWQANRNYYYFNRFLKINKKRKISIKNIKNNNYIYNKQSKHSNFYNKKPYQTDMVIQKSTPNLNRPLLLKYLNQTVIIKTMTSLYYMWTLFINPFLLKLTLFNVNYQNIHQITKSLSHNNLFQWDQISYTNLSPDKAFNKIFTKKVLNSFANKMFREDIIPLYQNTLIRFIEFCTGKKALFQFYPFVNQHISKEYMVRYRRWLPRMNFYERQLGHRFFLEESLHIIHISFILRDPKILASWLKAMILRISFWKTRSIFRFLKYLFQNYFIHVFDDIKIKGLKIKLKGKISAAGNSRKRTILYRIGKTSHSEVNLRVVKDFSLINTFTGVMGFQVYLFY